MEELVDRDIVTQNGDDIDEDLIEEDDQEDSDDREEEDDDECVESRPLTPDEDKKPIDGICGNKKQITSKNQMNSTYRGTFTWKIVKKKAQDLDKGKLVAFGSTAVQKQEELTNQQILERKQKIQKHYQGPYKKKKNISLFCSVPKNLEEQKILFFDSNWDYNPQFIYENENLTRKYLKQFYNDANKSPDGIPLANSDLLKSAQKILKAFIKEFGTESDYLQTEGDVLTREDTESIINEYLTDLQLEKLITLNFTKNIVAPTSIAYDPKKKKTRMNIRLPVEYRAERIVTMLNHEIGTHFIRRLNDKKQKWYGKKDKYDIRSWIMTEEGFAVVNQYCEHALNPKKRPYFYKAALNYYAAYQAGVMSFSELYKDLEQYIDDPYRRWNFTLRVKRGLTDTSIPGGLYKDQVYLEGAFKILKDRKNINFMALISGKISLDDLNRPFLMKILKFDNLYIPPFMRDMKKFMKGLDRLAKINFVE